MHSLTKIEALPYGLDEMKMMIRLAIPIAGTTLTRSASRSVGSNISKFPVESIAFERVRNVSAQLDAVYSAALGPFIRAFSTPLAASVLEWAHPMRTSRYAFASAFNPLFAGVIASLASFIRLNPHPTTDDNPFKSQELATIKAISDLVYCLRHLRDDGCEQLFNALYGQANPLARLIQNTPDNASLKDDHQRAHACSTVRHHNLAA